MSSALRLRLKLKELSESLHYGKFTSREKSLTGFDPEEVRPLKSGDSPASSSFDLLRSALYKKYFLRVKLAEKSVRVLLCLDSSPSMRAAFEHLSKYDFTITVCEEIVEGLTEGLAEIGFVVWSQDIEDVFPPLGGESRARERLVNIREADKKHSSTNPSSLFEYLLLANLRPSLVFVFSDWHDSEDFNDALSRCLAAKIDIIPVVVRDTFNSGTPRFLGDVNFMSSESKSIKSFGEISGEAYGTKTFLFLGLPFIEISSNQPDEEWRKGFVKFFEYRENERR